MTLSRHADTGRCGSDLLDEEFGAITSIKVGKAENRTTSDCSGTLWGKAVVRRREAL